MIGQQFARILKVEKIPFIGTRYSRSNKNLVKLNILQDKDLRDLLSEISPNVILNCISLAGGVNFCQNNPEMGRKYYVGSTKIMVDWCGKNDATLAYISTDYVFDGKQQPYCETDVTNPLNFYGEYKLEGENYIRGNLEHYVIARTTNVYGWDPKTQTPNFLMHLINVLKERNSIDVPGFLYGTPTYASDLTMAILDLLERRNYGLYHIVGPDYITRYDWAVKCLEMAGIKSKTLIKQENPPDGWVPRPLFSHLLTEKFHQVSQVKLQGVESGLEMFVKAMK